jgi:hypothetical protein
MTGFLASGFWAYALLYLLSAPLAIAAAALTPDDVRLPGAPDALARLPLLFFSGAFAVAAGFEGYWKIAFGSGPPAVLFVTALLGAGLGLACVAEAICGRR